MDIVPTSNINRESSVRIDLPGRIRKTTVPVSRPLLPLHEAIANSVHAIEDAQKSRTSAVKGRIDITLQRGPVLEGFSPGQVESIIVEDNGAGFTPVNLGHFDTADTTHKADIGGKGVGRFTWLVTFEDVKIESRYGDGDSWTAFTFSAHHGVQSIPNYDPRSLRHVRTKVTLSRFKLPWRERCPQTLDLIAADVIEHFIALFVGSTEPEIFLNDGAEARDLRKEFRENYEISANKKLFKIDQDEFTATGLRLRRVGGGRSHRILYLAHQREVKTETLSSQINGLPNPLQDDNGNFYYVAFVQGDALDTCVDVDRSSFRIPDTAEDEESPELFRQLTWRDLRKGAVDVIKADLAPWLDEIKKVKREKIEKFVAQQEPQYQVLMRDAEQIIADLPANPVSSDIDRVMSKRLFERREGLKRESDRLLSELEAAPQADPERYRERMEKAIKESGELGIADLARYVCHRKVILRLLDTALRLQDTGHYGREEAIHSLIYPMRKTSLDVEYYSHNLWLIDERLAYSWRIYSDIPLSTIDIGDIRSAKELDLLIFDHPILIGDDESPLTSVTIVEFKRPMRTDYRKERVTTQVFNYKDLVQSGRYKDHTGRTVKLRTGTPVTIYVIADFTDELRRDMRDTGLRKLPDGESYFMLQDDYYLECISYDKLLRNARMRNSAFFKVLGLPTHDKGD